MTNAAQSPWNQRLHSLWNSATLVTWAGYSTRTLSILFVLPLVLKKLTAGEIAIYYLFNTILGFQALADMGFTWSFSRLIAYAMGGAVQLRDFRTTPAPLTTGATPNWEIMGRICGTMRTVYARLTLLSFVLIGTLGTWALCRPISRMDSPITGWLAWSVVAVSSIVGFWGLYYISYLRGTNRVALVARWDTVFSLATVLTNLVVMLAGGGLLALVISTQLWLVLSVLCNGVLARRADQGLLTRVRGKKNDPEVFAAVWPSVWRLGVQTGIGYGIVESSTLIYAQYSSSASLAAYLLALRIRDIVSGFSMAPFYTKIPRLSSMRAEGRVADQLALARRSMRRSYWAFVLPALAVGFLAPSLLHLIGSNAAFVPVPLWALLILAGLLDRFGSMHLQLYSTTNHIILHIAQLGYAIWFGVVAWSLFAWLGLYAFALGMLAGQLGFHAWYGAWHCYRLFGLKAWTFEKTLFIPPFLVTLAYVIYVLASETF